jgi:hypothetical protein
VRFASSSVIIYDVISESFISVYRKNNYPFVIFKRLNRTKSLKAG